MTVNDWCILWKTIYNDDNVCNYFISIRKKPTAKAAGLPRKKNSRWWVKTAAQRLPSVQPALVADWSLSPNALANQSSPRLLPALLGNVVCLSSPGSIISGHQSECCSSRVTWVLFDTDIQLSIRSQEHYNPRTTADIWACVPFQYQATSATADETIGVGQKQTLYIDRTYVCGEKEYWHNLCKK